MLKELIIAEKAIAALKPLAAAKSAKAIVTLLAEKGVKGTPADGADCPIAAYLIRAIGNHKASVIVDCDVIQIEGPDGPSLLINVSPAMQQFVEEFDSIRDSRSTPEEKERMRTKYAAVFKTEGKPKAKKKKA